MTKSKMANRYSPDVREQLTAQDIAELERILLENGVADPDIIATIQADGGIGQFLRSLTGLDRAAAKQAFSAFLSSRNLSADRSSSSTCSSTRCAS
ncbi:type I restriction enzyme, R subunit [Paracoccus alcaliphilus]|uniref:Type I restriction enzyme, R subunit n=1 Tax=Paracoccus alcaliphilus TaxID=34002 RepID=A0A1H8LTH0_9RHOB|nr:type I restriction-modification enzyme R subunit C-terminal domain-containing protein [Paracoccus alcaliphilus]WCR17257.1 hypothetical protein JHW40_12935 [Paracoccus alcaliphilus]SEO08405.1 type I restriction enzyme, R subunit [Paracoccus alcaliphilus]